MALPPRATYICTATRESAPEGSGTNRKTTLPYFIPITGVPLRALVTRDPKDREEKQGNNSQNHYRRINPNIDPGDYFRCSDECPATH